MLIQPATRAGAKRRGVILLVVLALLTLFAILGLSFVYYSDAEANSSRIFREAATLTSPGSDNTRSNIDANAAWSMFLGQLVYDVNDDDFGVMSALRGHSLARTMYGWNDPLNGQPGAYSLNDKPFCGTGRLNESITFTSGTAVLGQRAVNYTCFPVDKSLRDPGRQGIRASPTQTRGNLVGDVNVPYTYPDHNNMFLAMLDPNSGQVLTPSYFRYWLIPNAGANVLGNSGNAYWTSADGKYYLMRPRPSDMGDASGNNFPYPASAKGDVKNLDLAPGGNDSIWIDFNAPVVTLPDGSQYKILAAPLIIDLDGRINLNVAGNTMASNYNSHASNQGWGPYEMNISTALSANTSEWLNVFQGTTLANGTSVPGRYGSGTGSTPLPLGQLPTSGGQPLRNNFLMDYNGVQDGATPNQLSKQWNLPGNGSAQSYQNFPYYDPKSYGNYTNEINAPNPVHASIYNPMRPAQGNFAFNYNDLASVLRRTNVGGDAVSSNLLNLLPNNLIGNGLGDTNAALRRSRVTTHSFDLDRAGVVPYYMDSTGTNGATAAQQYRYNGAVGAYPTGSVGLQLTAALLNKNPQAGTSEFDPNTFQSVLAAINRVDLTRKLTQYPALGTNAQYPNQFDPTNATFQQAVSDRQQMAADILNALIAATGAAPLSSLPGTFAQTTDQYRAVRWLAQLAVNIVDFIDYDSYSTPFQWLSGQFVFGTELPQLVINEYYSQWDDDVNNLTTPPPRPRKATTNYRVNTWVELYNPMQGPSDLGDTNNGGAVLLYNGKNQGNSKNPYPIYRVVVCQGPNVNIRQAVNVRGNWDAGMTHYIVNNWGLTAAAANQATMQSVAPGSPYPALNGPAGSNAGFYVLGAHANGKNPYQAPLGPTNPRLTSTFESDNMSYLLPVANNPTTAPAMGATDYRPSILLERLANPYLAPQPTFNSTTPWTYNPYITVDYVSQVTVNDGRIWDVNGRIAGFQAPSTRSSYGRMQPYAAAVTGAPATTQWVKQTPNPALAASPQNTFYSQNTPKTTPFDVQYHPDRVPISMADLLHVSGYKPHEFTQQFVIDDGTGKNVLKFAHRAPWTDQTARILRVWELLTISNRMNGFAKGGRIPGKININSIWDPTTGNPPVFSALCDPQGANLFAQADINKIWTALLANRSQDTDTTTGSNMPGPNSVPFWGTGVGYTTAYDLITANFTTPTTAPQQIYRGVSSTTLRPSTLGSQPSALTIPGQPDLSQLRLLEPSGATVYPNQPVTQSLQRFELLSKILGNVTTRSNVFGVWVTFGFFKVTNANTQPVQLGAEYIWPNSQAPIRHKFFAIIDRTQLQVWPTYNANGQATVTSTAAITLPTNNGVTATWTTASVNLSGTPVTNSNTGRTWTPGWQQNPQASGWTVLTFDPDTSNEETVFVLNSGTFTVNATSAPPGLTAPVVLNAGQAVFFKNHSANCTVISRGNPGPWTQYDPTQDPYVVPYAAKIN